MSITSYCKIERAKAIRILIEVEQAVSRWRELGHALGMTTAELDQFTDAFEHRERDAVNRQINS